uniref:Poly(ADP-ribose) polymerase pme-5 (inferred by orthology to a C. elegans protein) n=1 Tax=Anisakis simplex TaxID=6269 RepID=A0A0M3J133_ANISI
LKSTPLEDSAVVKSPSKTPKKTPVRIEVEDEQTQTVTVVEKKSKSKKVSKFKKAKKLAKSSKKTAKKQKGAAVKKSNKTVSAKKGIKSSDIQSVSTPSSSSPKRPRDDIPKPIEVKPKPAEPKKKKHKNDKLIPRLDIPDMQLNSFFYGKTNPKFISVSSYARIAHRFVLKKDLNGLKRVIADGAHFHSDALRSTYSESYELTPECEAVLTEDLKFIDDMLKLSDKLAKDTQSRVTTEPLLLKEVETGKSNVRMLGHRTRPVQMTRGGREGINALLKHDEESHADLNERLQVLIEKNISFATLEHIASLASTYNTCVDISSECTSLVVHAVRFGHRKLAGKMIEAYSKYNFNDLHLQTLLNDRQPLKKFKQVSVLKKGQMNDTITPIHTAAINPNVAYLKALADVEPNFNIPDAKNWYTIHYAAVCEGPAPLKFLLERGAPFVQTNKQKDLPLHCAARTGRVENVRVLLEAMQKSQVVDDLDDQEASDLDDEHHPNGESSQAETED